MATPEARAEESPQGSAPGSHLSSSGGKSSKVFAIVLILFEILFFLITGILYRLREDTLTTMSDFGGVLLVCILTILIIIGFGLINSYISHSAISGLAQSLIVFAVGIQSFFLFRAFWEKAGNFYYSDKFETGRFKKITLSNIGNDRQAGADSILSAPFGEAIACSISLVIALGAIVGRTKLLSLCFFSIFGAALYECNAQFIWRWFVTDSAFGLRVILFGGFYGLVCSLLLGNKEKTKDHPRYASDYQQASFAMFGFLLVWICYPFMSVLTIMTYTKNDAVVLYAVTINMFLAMASSVLGTFVACSFLKRRFGVNELIFTGLSGTFLYSSCADINFNPATPLVSSFFLSFISSMLNKTINWNINKNGILLSLPHIQRFVVPGVLAGLLSAIIHGLAKSQNGTYGPNAEFPDRSAAQQGGEQILAIAVTVGFALLAGVISGIVMRIVHRKMETEDHFTDALILKRHEA